MGAIGMERPLERDVAMHVARAGRPRDCPVRPVLDAGPSASTLGTSSGRNPAGLVSALKACGLTLVAAAAADCMLNPCFSLERAASGQKDACAGPQPAHSAAEAARRNRKAFSGSARSMWNWSGPTASTLATIVVISPTAKASATASMNWKSVWACFQSLPDVHVRPWERTASCLVPSPRGTGLDLGERIRLPFRGEEGSLTFYLGARGRRRGSVKAASARSGKLRGGRRVR
jgi:hypothetical protein